MKREKLGGETRGPRPQLPLMFSGLFFLVLSSSASAPAPVNGIGRFETPPSAQTVTEEEPRALLQKATQALQENRLDEAESQARSLLTKAPESWEGHFLLGLILFRRGHAAESLAEYSEGAKHHDPQAADLKVVALDYVLLKDYSDADRWLTKSVTWNPTDAEAWYYLGRTKYQENRFEEAIAAFQKCLTIANRHVKAKANLGLSLAGLGKFAEAEAAYREAMAWQADAKVKIAEPYIDLGDLLLDQNRTEDAIAALMQAEAIAPEDARIPELLGKAFLRENKLPEARVQLEKAVKLAAGSAANHYLLGQVYRKLGMQDEARSELAVAAALSTPHDKPASQ